MRTALLLLPCLALLGCPSDPGPCSACPPIQGKWALTYDGYDAGDLSDDCASISPPKGPATVEILRNGALLHATLDGLDSQGQLADSFDFSITGREDLGGDAGNFRTVSLRGYYRPADVVVKPDGGTADAGANAGAGATLQAKWVTHTEQGSKACDAVQRCVGTRN